MQIIPTRITFVGTFRIETAMLRTFGDSSSDLDAESIDISNSLLDIGSTLPFKLGDIDGKAFISNTLLDMDGYVDIDFQGVDLKLGGKVSEGKTTVRSILEEAGLIKKREVVFEDYAGDKGCKRVLPKEEL